MQENDINNLEQQHQYVVERIQTLRAQIADGKAWITKTQGEVNALMVEQNKLWGLIKVQRKINKNPSGKPGRPRMNFEDLSPATKAQYASLERRMNKPAAPNKTRTALEQFHSNTTARIAKEMQEWLNNHPSIVSTLVVIDDSAFKYYYDNLRNGGELTARLHSILTELRKHQTNPLPEQHYTYFITMYAQWREEFFHYKGIFGCDPYWQPYIQYINPITKQENGEAIIGEIDSMLNNTWTGPVVESAPWKALPPGQQQTYTASPTTDTEEE